MTLSDILKSIGNRINKDLLYMQKESDSRNQLSRLLPEYFPYNHYTIKYYDLERIVNQIMFTGANDILELGSGLSTLCIAALTKYDGSIKVHSIEHHPEWHGLMLKLIKMNNLKNIQLDLVPLKPFQEDSFSGMFFDLSNVTFKDNYDAVIIDGPPANKKELVHSRYPAIHILKRHLKKKGFFYFDDVRRKGEAECLNNWKHNLSFYRTPKHQFGNGQIFILK